MNITHAHRTPPTVLVDDFVSPAVSGDDVLSESLVQDAGYATRTLPAALYNALSDFSVDAGVTGALLVRGVGIGELPATPPTPGAAAHSGKDLISEFNLLTVARALGQPVGYLPEHGGDIVQNIVPVQASANRQVSTSSKVQLMFHTEAAFHPHRPRYLLLLCLRGDASASTTLSSIREVAPLLDPAVVEVLFQPRFRTAPDESYLRSPNSARTESLPTDPSDSLRSPLDRSLGAAMAVLGGSRQAPTLVFDADLMVGIDDEAADALKVLSAAVAAHHTGVVLEPGDLLVIDNTVAVHGRSPFTPRFDGTDRWLQRTFVVSDLAPSAADRVGRIIATQFD
jgi:L-asparagine oxygenase